MSAQVINARYQLGARIGTGGVADVYEGMDLRLKRPVAVKVFRPGGDPALRERFADEAVLLAGLQHPGLVTLYDAGRHEDSAYLVMQLVKGSTLAQHISAGAMEPPYVVRLGAELAHALAHVHAAGIVHRDVKPSNVLLDAAGSPHLADFGISRMMNATRHTASGALIGTAAYLAPEQVLGKAVGPPADIFALGLVLLECLTGDMEYHGTPLEAAVARLHRRPTVPRAVPPRLAQLLTAMTDLDEQARPDAEECAEALSALCGTNLAPAPAADVDPGGTGGGTAAEHTVTGRGASRQERPAPTAHGPRTRRQQALGRPRRLLATGAAVLTLVLGATLAVSPDGEGAGDDQAAPGSLGSTPAKPPPGTGAPESPRKEVRQPTASPSPAPSQASRTLTSPASDEKPPMSPSASSARPGPRTAAGHEGGPRERPRPGAARSGDKNPPEKAPKPKDRAAEKPQR
ncbi:serine/threonine-protein kinase [Streptomyces azureus]|uniref:non-specific serine/threonine protein kinase n=1 Tax=Streptomyces azureus TaxID=146537 RepID=A0A0K8PJD1_STRAJ|nr:serine/threonine-protein kinase [Streptomyces azureus]GAP47509.1 protein kinase [Streptomyces azureus]